MRKLRVLSFTVVLSILCLGLFGCYESDGNELFFAGTDKKTAFIGEYCWNGDKDAMTVEIPDTYKGKKVVALGGYIGRGYPCPFCVSLPYGEIDFTTYSADDDEDYETLTFTVKIGKNVESIYAHGKAFHGKNVGEYDEDILYKVAYRFEVDEENPSFYCEDGKLYRKKDGSLVDEFFYD